MRPYLLLSSFLVALVFAGPSFLPATAGDCPLDMSWWNLTAAASVCSDQNGRAKCCRYINAFIAVSVAYYANATGELGVPSAFSDDCYNSISDTLKLGGIPSNATMFCGLGLKIHISYQCEGRVTISDMLQSPNFYDVIRNCKLPLSLDNSCKRCLNSGLSYLRHLVGDQDNITLNTCRDAAFVALANQGENSSIIDIATCFFSVKGFSIHQGNSSEPFFSPVAPATSPASAPIRAHDLFVKPFREHHHPFQLTLIPGIGIMITGSAILLLIILILLIHKKNRELRSASNPTRSTSDASSFPHVWKNKKGASTMFHRYSYKEIKKASGNFSKILGKSEFGILYKAQFDDGFVAAVKQIKNMSILSEEDFCREMEILGRLHHRHLVTLRGFCSSRQDRFMIYEFMENGSLKDQLYSSGRTPLPWKTRIQIAIDVANALEYLHYYCDNTLCHGDLRSSNVLFDKNFLAKVAYFGLEHSTRCASRHVPHNGYLDPEYMVTKMMTDKSDVYSYGVLLLELVVGKQASLNHRNLVQWSQELADSFRLSELVDPAIADAVDLEQLHVVVGIAKLCTQREVKERPSIKQILRMLRERLDASYTGFAKAVQGEGCHDDGRLFTEKQQENEVIALSGDARCLQSSSSTSRSYCSRSILLECNSPQSPHGI
ncbi:probable receptor-like protein kinase At1g49730 isoform X2 [Musa acuminata AAA Group]|uniref:probable receptor-like protein kinase At1g49730 isoform X2 n=1 Tax=Musa acuminata AAA Group TaxID=214697 RepID=UPI0031E1819A